MRLGRVERVGSFSGFTELFETFWFEKLEGDVLMFSHQINQNNSKKKRGRGSDEGASKRS